jgi:hypothetical protein
VETNQNLNPKPTAEGSIVASSSNLDWEKFFSIEEREKWNKLQELEAELRIKNREINTEIKEQEEEVEKIGTADAEKVQKIREKLNYNNAIGAKINILKKELGIYASDSDDELTDLDDYSSDEESADELSAKTAKGKEVIKAEISQELIQAKEIFANFAISETTQEEITRKINKHVERLENTWDGGDTVFNTISVIPIVGNVLGPIHTAGHSNQLERSFKRQAKEKLPQVVNKLITQATTDLEKQKKKVLKKMDALIEARNQEVVEAKKAIQALETVNQELAHKNKDLREKSDREIISLRDQIKELNEQLADFQKRKEEVEKAVRSKLYGKSEKLKIKAKMTDEKTQIAELEKELEDVRLIAKTLDESLGNERLQLEKTRSQLERETSRLNEDLKAKEDELERERKIAHDKIQSLNDEIKQWKKRKEEIEKERNKLDETNTDLEAKNKELKQKYEKAQAAADKWKKDYETEKALHEPTWIQKRMKDLGIVQFKNAIATSFSIAGVFVVLYAISWMYKKCH